MYVRLLRFQHCCFSTAHFHLQWTQLTPSLLLRHESVRAGSSVPCSTARYLTAHHYTTCQIRYEVYHHRKYQMEIYISEGSVSIDTHQKIKFILLWLLLHISTFGLGKYFVQSRFLFVFWVEALDSSQQFFSVMLGRFPGLNQY